MAGLDLFSVQDTIYEHVKTKWSGVYEVIEDGVPDAKTLLRVDNKVVNYIVLTWGNLIRKPGGKSMAGTRWDDYYSTVDVNVVGANGKRVRQSAGVIIDDLIGYRPTGGNEMGVRGNSTTMTIRDGDGPVLAYIHSQRMTFGVNGEDVGAHPTPTP